MPEITMRDYLALQMIPAVLSWGWTLPSDVVIKSYEFADAMLEARGTKDVEDAKEKICAWHFNKHSNYYNPTCEDGCRNMPSNQHCPGCGGRIVVKEKDNER
jgi:hypothetical protein